ncbi:MAG: sugar phosphate isomerase/epimerase [Chloroflexota bacterium]|jgi:sugar phosphate isomerase/epimerase|nr:sugar phosphate isomerase/epimerase [Chloroflexota bacterium]MDP6507717.1 sugar phosphate isomerase/epimerase [Chloroflexota bacterium]MDP6757002.1 sugar phosphate isomerase/epimerase [Chloroflexota bacterium]
MQVVLFTKFFEGMPVEAMGDLAAKFGYDGFDLAVRPGHAIDPANVTTALAPAVEHWRRQGLDCPMISLSTDAIDPDDPATVATFRAAGESGVPLVKIGYFPFEGGSDYPAVVEAARATLGRFSELAQRTGVRAMYHTHNGPLLGSNCAGLLHLLEGFDPVHVGAYVDMGHLATGGEDVAMGLSMVRLWLAAIGAKDARFAPVDDPDAAPWPRHFVYLGEGAADWPAALRLLHSWDFTGPFTVHTEYTLDQEVTRTVGGVDRSVAAEEMREHGRTADLRFLRDAWASLNTDR